MVKRREPKPASSSQPTQSQIEAFASEADGGAKIKKELDPHAKHDFKGIRVPFNEYEYSKLVELSAKTGRAKLNVIRWAILKLAEDER